MDSLPAIRLKPIDWITLAFCCWMLLLITIGWSRVIHPLHYFISYLSIVAGIFLLLWLNEFMPVFARPENCSNGICRRVRPRGMIVVAFLRSYYPVLLYLFFFESVSATNRIIFPQWLDPMFYRMDIAIFGYLPSMEWGIRYSSIWWKELFHLAYFCYYLMIIGLPVWFYIRKRQALDELVFVVSLVFYFCYFIFSWLPVIGGRYFPEAMQWTQVSDGGIFTALMAYIYISSPHLGGAFPSSHVAVALVLSLTALKYFRRLGIALLGITFFLSIATVYCHYHWFTDAVCGLITGFLGYFIALYIFNKLSEENHDKMA